MKFIELIRKSSAFAIIKKTRILSEKNTKELIQEVYVVKKRQ